MNAAGLTAILTSMSSFLESFGFFQDLVTDGSISQDELDGTRKNLSATVAALKRTPAEKIEAMVAQYNEELTAYSDKFNYKTGENALTAFRSAQVMTGSVTTIMNKAGISD